MTPSLGIYRARHRARLMVSLEQLAKQAECEGQDERARQLWLEREAVQDERSALLRRIWSRSKVTHGNT